MDNWKATADVAPERELDHRGNVQPRTPLWGILAFQGGEDVNATVVYLNQS